MTTGFDEGRDPAELSQRLRELKGEVARVATEDFLENHPDWLERYGERARRLGEEDAEYHVDFLAGALVVGSVESFRRYVRWTANMLGSRGIEPRFLDEFLERIGEHLEPRLDPPDWEKVRNYLDGGRDACRELEPADAESESPRPHQEVREVYHQAALRGDRRAALTVVREALRKGMEPKHLYIDVLQEAQYEVGRLWAANRITVAQEHTATAVCQYVLTSLYHELPRPEERRGPAVITGVEGELHQLGANMVADLLEMDGWNVRFLGTQMPHDGIIEAAKEMGADLVGISATMLFNVPQVGELIGRLREELSDAPPRIVVGGSAFRADPEAWMGVGADAIGRDLSDAIEVVRKLSEAE